MPAQNGVWSNVYPCCGSQMPCSQMISMNIRPPRPSADRNVETVPKVNARILNRLSRNIGWATRVSMSTKAASRAAPAARRAMTRGLPQPMACPP